MNLKNELPITFIYSLIESAVPDSSGPLRHLAVSVITSELTYVTWKKHIMLYVLKKTWSMTQLEL